MKFKFRLSKVLDHLALKERKKRRELQLGVQERKRLEKLIEQIGLEADQLLERRNNRDLSWAVSDELVENSVNRLREKRERLLHVSRLLVNIKKELSRIQARRKAIEKLKEARLSEFKKNAAKSEQKQLEDLFRFRKFN